MHSCYIIQSQTTNRLYIGYTIDFFHRLRQHNGEIVGGAKKTSKGRPWKPICIILGFYEKSSALRFEYRLQHPKKQIRTNIISLLEHLVDLINHGDGSLKAIIPWPLLNIIWFDLQYEIQSSKITNAYYN